MDITIKKMESEPEIKGKAYVHWKSWQEAYPGLVSQEYLDKLTLEKCIEIAYRWPNNILVAMDGEKVVGFVAYGACRDDDSPNAGEIYAIYILEEYYDRKVGYALMNAALEKLTEYSEIVVWVLAGNERAIRFYEKCGFRFSGVEQQIVLGTEVTECQMLMQR